MIVLKSIFTIIGLGLSIILHTQTKGIHVVLKDGTSLEGKIEELNYLKYTDNSIIEIKDKGETNKLEVADINYLEIQDKGRYETHSVNETNYLFFVKLDGKIKLLYHKDQIYTLSSDSLLLLSQEIGTENYYKKNLAFLVGDDSEYIKQLPDIEFKKSALVDFLSNYNNNRANEKSIIYSNPSKVKTNFMIGYTKRFDQSFDAAPLASSGVEFNSNVFTLEATFSNVDYVNNLSLTTGIWYTQDSYKLEGSRNVSQFIESKTIVTGSGESITQMDTTTVINIIESGSYSANSIEIPVYLEFLNSQKFISYYGAAGFSLKTRNVKREFEISDDIEETILSGNLLIELGLAIMPIKNIRINIAYNFDTQINIRARILF